MSNVETVGKSVTWPYDSPVITYYDPGFRSRLGAGLLRVVLSAYSDFTYRIQVITYV